jgi:hypothetical protein
MEMLLESKNYEDFASKFTESGLNFDCIKVLFDNGYICCATYNGEEVWELTFYGLFQRYIQNTKSNK